MQQLIKKYKNYKKKQFITLNSNKQYAFVGMGTHSIYNLYPIINHFRLNLKYIVTKSNDNAKLIDQNFTHSIGTNDFNMVLNDPDVSGVFISTSPQAHFELVKQSLKAGKNVFVEKPPCLNIDELNELIEIEKKSEGTCLVGLQKQYAPCNTKLKQINVKNSTYNYRYITGAYPEGDPLLDLFIHPLSLVNFIFGNIDNKQISVAKNNGNITIFIHLTHKDKTLGNIELSTNYSWNNTVENLIVNTNKGIYSMKNTEHLSFEPKTGSVMGIPIEKIMKGNNKTIQLTQRDNFAPILANNQLYSSGYYNEIKTFINICENKKTINNTSLTSCKEVYSIIKEIREQINVQ